MSANDEDKTEAGVRRPARQEARLYHQLRQRSAIGPPPRPAINMPRLPQPLPISSAPQNDAPALQHDDGSTRDFRSGPRRELSESRLTRHAGSREALRHGASLRAALASFLGIANAVTKNRFTGGATHLNGVSLLHRLPISVVLRMHGESRQSQNRPPEIQNFNTPW